MSFSSNNKQIYFNPHTARQHNIDHTSPTYLDNHNHTKLTLLFVLDRQTQIRIPTIGLQHKGETCLILMRWDLHGQSHHNYI